MEIRKKIFCIKISNQKELDFVRKLYTIEEHKIFHDPILMYLNNKYRYIAFDYVDSLLNTQYTQLDFTILDIKYLMRIEKLKRINENT